MSEKAKNIALMGVFTALTLVLSLLESYLPPLVPFVPYIKIGFSNIAVLFILVVLGTPYALISVIIKCLLVAIFSGAISTVLYSLPASVLSVTVMFAFLRLRLFTLRFVSVIGALTHIIVQLLVAVFVTGSISVLLYAPYLLLVSMISGAVVGYVNWFIIQKYPFGKTIDK